MQLAAGLLKSQVQEVEATGVSAERPTARQMGFEEDFSSDKPRSVSEGQQLSQPSSELRPSVRSGNSCSRPGSGVTVSHLLSRTKSSWLGPMCSRGVLHCDLFAMETLNFYTFILLVYYWNLWICLLSKTMGSEQTPRHAKLLQCPTFQGRCPLKRTKWPVPILPRCRSQQRWNCTNTNPLEAEGLKEVVLYRRFRRMWIQMVPERKKKKAIETYNLGRGISPAER